MSEAAAAACTSVANSVTSGSAQAQEGSTSPSPSSPHTYTIRSILKTAVVAESPALNESTNTVENALTPLAGAEPTIWSVIFHPQAKNTLSHFCATSF
ncbi:unnamed protein product [Gongylonema pulchrum]|uniref:Uncharacterized protein n=1 Tax=Gongylonema pulchrum TaxID=637853 RepID=A0A183EDC4_9BILA|nr:unnamed protein product [Gongylonema pulchrum]